MAGLFIKKIARYALRRGEVLLGRFYPIEKTLEAMALRPYELHLELTNLCNANCVFCPYQFQTRSTQFMSDEVFEKAVSDYVRCGGGSVGLTPIVGDALIDPRFLERVRYLRSRPEIDRIWLITNAILLDKHGVDNVLNSGISAITISTSGYDEATYKRIYRSTAYQRHRRNVQELVELNSKRADPIPITIGLRVDRPLRDVMKDPDFQPILKHHPGIDFTWSFTSAGGRITREALPAGMRLRVVSSRKEPCVQLYNGPIVLADGTVMACSCVAAIDATQDLGVGNVLEGELSSIWTSPRVKQLRDDFAAGTLGKTCASCDMYRAPDLYRLSEGRMRADINRRRHSGEIVHRGDRPEGPFAGG